MTEATQPYLRSPVKVENNYTNAKPNVYKFLGYSVALGILSYYAPKTFLGASVVIAGHQVYRFNQLVQRADKSKHREIHAWTINACQVMGSVGFVLGFQSIPWLVSSFKAAKHFHLFRSGTHLVPALLFVAVGWGAFSPFKSRSEELAKQHRWIQMENYVENYPRETKTSISFSMVNKIAFFIGALFPQTTLIRSISFQNPLFCQFGSSQDKFSSLREYFSKRCSVIPLSGTKEWKRWIIAIHQFQELPIEAQLALGPRLAIIAEKSSEEQRKALPDEVQLVLFNENLKNFITLPTYSDEHYSTWEKTINKLHEYDQERKLGAFGAQLFRIIQASVPYLVSYLPENFRVVALKYGFQLLKNTSTFTPDNYKTTDKLMDGLPPQMYKKFGPDVAAFTTKATQHDIDQLSVPTRLALLHYRLSESANVPLSDYFFLTSWNMIEATYENLPSHAKLNQDIIDELTRIAKASPQDNIDKLAPSLKIELTHLKRNAS